MRKVYLALLVGMIPTVSMVMASFFLSHVTVSGVMEACFQNFAAGLILAAVAAELFPLLLANDVSTTQSVVGITVGFAIGLMVLNATEWFVGKFIDVLNRLNRRDSLVSIIQSLFQPRAPVVSEQSVGVDIVTVPDTSATRKKTDISFNDIEEKGLSCELRAMRMRAGSMDENGSSRDLLSEWMYDPVELSSVAIALPNHRSHLEEHLVEIHTDVVAMEAKSCRLVGDDQLSQRDTEQIAEEIDEAIHLLQYKLDHCRRLLEGSEIEVKSPASRGDGPGISRVNTTHPFNTTHPISNTTISIHSFFSPQSSSCGTLPVNTIHSRNSLFSPLPHHHLLFYDAH